MTPPRVLIIGASSAIAEAVARLYAQRGATLALVARDAQKLSASAADLHVRGAAGVFVQTLDANELRRHEAVIAAAMQSLGGFDVVLIAHGTLSDQAACQQSVELTLQEFQTNALSAISLCTLLANRLEAQRSGTLAVISSVAGDRGRASNYVYGSAKAAVTAFLSGLRARLAPAGVNVLTIKPGLVDTPMTSSFRKGAIWATPQKVAADIVRAIDDGKRVLYTPWFWRGIMLIIRSIPEWLFVRYLRKL